MKRIPYEIRVEYWRFQFAKLCFANAQHLIQKLINESLDRDDPLSGPLMLTAVVDYARPFKQKRPFRFPESIIPKDLIPIHMDLIIFRDKSLAHMDPDGPAVDGNVTNKLVMQVLRNGKLHLGMEMSFPSPKQYAEMLRLTTVLRKKAQYYANKIWDKYMAKETAPAGRYEVNLAKGDGELLIPYAPWCDTPPQQLGGQQRTSAERSGRGGSNSS